MKAEDRVMDLAKRRGFIWGPSPNIYGGGVSGFYDWGPLGKLLKNKVSDIIRKGFNSFDFWEVECPTIMPKEVWTASGHLNNFTDNIIKCVKCNSYYRIDKLIEEKYPDIDAESMSLEKLENFIQKNKIKCPSCGGNFGSIEPFDLMMGVTVGKDQEAYLRPETATTTYLLFPEYYRFFRTKLPFGVFQIGKAYRNEISPRQGVLRTREFTQAEAQLFILKSNESDFDKFDEINEDKLPMIPFGKKMQEINLKTAVNKKIVKKKTFAWVLFVAYNIIKEMGFDNKKMRIRQHNPNELAHYASDAWDIEIDTERFGWFEICGVHDRGDYDLKQHSKFSKTNLAAGNEYPTVLEIAFGLERPTYCLLEMSLRQDKVREWLHFPMGMAPIDVAIFPLMKRDGLDEMAKKIFKDLDRDFICIYDDAGSIGRRYRRMDEVGTSLCITVDHDSLTKNDVTIREISTMKQIRVKISDLKSCVKEMLSGNLTFDKIK